MQVRIRYLLTHLEAGQAEDAEPEQRSLMFFFSFLFLQGGWARDAVEKLQISSFAVKELKRQNNVYLALKGRCVVVEEKLVNFSVLMR